MSVNPLRITLLPGGLVDLDLVQYGFDTRRFIKKTASRRCRGVLLSSAS